MKISEEEDKAEEDQSLEKNQKKLRKG